VGNQVFQYGHHASVVDVVEETPNVEEQDSYLKAPLQTIILAQVGNQVFQYGHHASVVDVVEETPNVEEQDSYLKAPLIFVLPVDEGEWELRGKHT
jgi:uncharacterized protein (DUF1499 family)